MKVLKMALDKQDNVTLSLYQVDDQVCLRKSRDSQQELYRQYKSLSEATKAFDRQIQEDYRVRGIYYNDFFDET
ncbi:MAG: hypothetical protein Tp1111DCM1126091_139 [Prokaryotic dsDNA virus sp.]|nr:MAG: hypothetical protein Tp1111DCM1126091_139 [Prokaryotic dsDNA virus sp.]